MPLLGNDPARRDRPIRTGRRDKPIIQLPSIALRVAVVMGVALAMFGIVFFRLWFLQILSGQEFVAQANDNRLKSIKIAAPRGNIVDRHGEVIVENRGGEYVGIRLMDVPEGTLDTELERLAPHLKMKVGKLREAITDYLKPSTMELETVTVGDEPNEARGRLRQALRRLARRPSTSRPPRRCPARPRSARWPSSRASRRRPTTGCSPSPP